MHHSKVRSLTLDAWEPEIIKVMLELGNRVVNKIYEAKYTDDDKDGIQRATDGCDSSIREAWIRAKYVEKRFVLPLLNVNNVKLANGEQNEEEPEEDLKPNLSGKRWSVRKLRRRPNSRTRMHAETSTAPINTPPATNENNEDDANSLNSENSGNVVFIGKDLASEPLMTDEFDLSSDQESTGGEDSELFPADEDLSKLNPNLLLYKAAAAHNLPVMCHALALGASKNWINQDEGGSTPIHQAVLSVSKLIGYMY